MNSTQESHSRLPEETESSQQLASADSNANLTSQSRGTQESKGAIPKTKPAVKIKSNPAKKSIKVNNNVEEVSLLVSSLENDILKMNGISNGISPSPYFKSTSAESCSYLSEKSGSAKPIQCDTDPVNCVTPDPCCSYNKNIEVKLDTVSSSDDDELLSLSDDGCIYTYKGDQVADLPTSFFSLDMPPLESPNPSNRQNSSPEMDFLEMDFDPGPSGEADSDSVSNDDVECAENLPEDEKEKDGKIEEDVQVHSTNHKPCDVDSVKVNGKSDLDLPGPSSSKVNFSNIIQNNNVRVVKCYKRMPWTCSVLERTVASQNINMARRYHCVKGEVLSPSENLPVKSFPKWLYYDHLLTKDIFDVTQHKEAIMIWTEQEAHLKQVSQIGPSACGATSVLNVLSALRFPIPPLEKVIECITTRLRANSSPLCEYLLSRSIAGTTHRDIIDCLGKVTNGQVYARFFHMYPERIVNLYTWLGFWIKKGAVPVATLNLQKCIGGTVPDAWHHQMVFGVGPKGIYLTNPIECVEAGHLWPQLCSESVLLIRREDVLSRWNFKTDLPEIMKIKDYRWHRINVVGQVANLIYESRRELRFGFRNTSHIKIPAAYSSGITLVIPVTSPACSLLRQCPELPLLQPKNTNTAFSILQQQQLQ